MGENTLIEWADHTYNHWMGCTKVQLKDGSISEECRHCYAEDMMDKRFNKVKWGKGQPRVLTSEKNRNLPYRWQREAVASGTRPRVFCSSLSDVFDAEIPIEWLADLLQIIEDTPNLDWLILTKRPENIMGDPFEFDDDPGRLKAVIDLDGPGKKIAEMWWNGAPPKNVWLGTTAGTNKSAQERIPELIKVPAYVRFLSIEPLLDYIVLEPLVVEQDSHYGGFTGGDPRNFFPDMEMCSEEEIANHKKACEAWDKGKPEESPQKPPSIMGQLVKDKDSEIKDPKLGPVSYVTPENFEEHEGKEVVGSFIACGTSGLGIGTTTWTETGIHWVIVGGESGDKARPMHPFWALSIKNECEELKIPFLFKQWGDWAPRDCNIMADGDPLCVHDPNMETLESLTVDDGAGSSVVMQKIGKKKAGKYLSGELYLNFPETTHHEPQEV